MMQIIGLALFIMLAIQGEWLGFLALLGASFALAILWEIFKENN